MAKTNLIVKNNITIDPREVDFVTRFGLTWEALREILGIMRPIKKVPGAVLRSKKVELTLENGNVGEGEEIPYSEATIIQVPYAEMGIEKYAKAVSIEAIKEYGYDVAVGKTDDKFLYELQSNVMNKFYSYLNTGSLIRFESSFQKALAMAKGYVVEKFKAMKLQATKVVAFVNVLDVYDYLGTQNITVQSQFGFDYIKNFMGYDTIFLVSGNEVERGKVIATPVENICLYYVDPSESDFAKAGLEYTVDGETNLIGFHTQGDYKTAVTECFALMGMTLFSEYLDGIAVITVGNEPEITEDEDDETNDG